MADKRELLQFRHLEHHRLEGGRMTVPVIIRCSKCGQRHQLELKEAVLTTVHCNCGHSTEVMLEKKAA